MAFWMAIPALISAYGAYKSSQDAGKAMDSQEKMSAADMAFRQQQYDRYLGMYGPIEERLAAEARSNQPLGYDQMKAQIQTGYADAGRNLASSMAGRGIAGSGQDVAGMRGLAMGQANALTGAYAQGLDKRRELGMALTGRNQIGQSAQNLQGGMQGMANLYGQRAGMYNQAAAAGWENFGKSLGEWGSTWGSPNAADAEPESGNAPGINTPVAPDMQPMKESRFNNLPAPPRWQDYMQQPQYNPNRYQLY